MKLIDYLRSNAIRCAAADADADVIFFGVRKGKTSITTP